MTDHRASLLWSEILSYQPKDDMTSRALHTHTFFHCFYVVDGRGSTVVGGETLPLTKGCFYATPPGVAHDFGAEGNTPMILAEIKFELEEADAASLLDACRGGVKVENTPVYSVMKRIRNEFSQKGSLSDELLSCYMAELFIYLERCVRGAAATALPTISDGKILEAVLYIEKNLGEEITLTELAGMVFLEKTYFLKRFKAAMGCTPIRYARNVRMSKAKELLVFSDKNVTEIADMLGFASVHHFSKSFLRDVGVSPSVYKKENRSV